jgi:hypothetical protein
MVPCFNQLLDKGKTEKGRLIVCISEAFYSQNSKTNICQD